MRCEAHEENGMRRIWHTVNAILPMCNKADRNTALLNTKDPLVPVVEDSGSLAVPKDTCVHKQCIHLGTVLFQYRNDARINAHTCACLHAHVYCTARDSSHVYLIHKNMKPW
jgi:hypothetical protein